MSFSVLTARSSKKSRGLKLDLESNPIRADEITEDSRDLKWRLTSIVDPSSMPPTHTNQTGQSIYELKVHDSYFSTPSRSRRRAATEAMEDARMKKAAKAQKKAAKREEEH